MSTLHILSHSPFSDSRFSSCLALLGTDDALLLTGDASYALQPGSSAFTSLFADNFSSAAIYVLNEDAAARHLNTPSGVTALDYPEFVELCTRYSKVNTWL